MLAGWVLAKDRADNANKKTSPLSDQTGVTFFHQKQKGKPFDVSELFSVPFWQTQRDGVVAAPLELFLPQDLARLPVRLFGRFYHLSRQCLNHNGGTLHIDLASLVSQHHTKDIACQYLQASSPVHIWQRLLVAAIVKFLPSQWQRFLC